MRLSSCSCSNADAQSASHPSSFRAGKTSLLCERVKLETRASAERVRLDEEPRALRKKAKRNRHQSRPPFAGDALTVAEGYGQHQPASIAPSPNVPRTLGTVTTFFAGVRKKSHSSAPRQFSNSQRPSGDQARFAITPAPVKTVLPPTWTELCP